MEMVRTQIQLTEEQARQARENARKLGISLAEFIRRALDDSLSQAAPGDRASVRRRSLKAIGCVASGTGDLSKNHDRHLERAYGR
jgi:hypothetical protein